MRVFSAIAVAFSDRILATVLLELAARGFFEVDRYWVTLAALKALADEGAIDRSKVAEAIVKYGIDINKPNPTTV